MKYQKAIISGLLVLILFILFQENLSAQCAMCKASAEANLREGGTAGRGLNRGIFMLMAMPYLLVGTIAFLWWKNRKSESELEEG